jgi:hypothetical protein
MARYVIGCAGMFATGSGLRGSDDEDEALVLAGEISGGECWDTVERRGFGPGCQEEVDGARERLEARRRAQALAGPPQALSGHEASPGGAS